VTYNPPNKFCKLFLFSYSAGQDNFPISFLFVVLVLQIHISLYNQKTIKSSFVFLHYKRKKLILHGLFVESVFVFLAVPEMFHFTHVS